MTTQPRRRQEQEPRRAAHPSYSGAHTRDAVRSSATRTSAPALAAGRASSGEAVNARHACGVQARPTRQGRTRGSRSPRASSRTLPSSTAPRRSSVFQSLPSTLFFELDRGVCGPAHCGSTTAASTGSYSPRPRWVHTTARVDGRVQPRETAQGCRVRARSSWTSGALGVLTLRGPLTDLENILNSYVCELRRQACEPRPRCEIRRTAATSCASRCQPQHLRQHHRLHLPGLRRKRGRSDAMPANAVELPGADCSG